MLRFFETLVPLHLGYFVAVLKRSNYITDAVYAGIKKKKQ